MANIPIHAYKDVFMASHSDRWDRAVLGIQDLLQHPEENVRELIRGLMQVNLADAYRMFNFYPDTLDYEVFEPCDYMENVARFIRQELLGDGNLGLAFGSGDSSFESHRRGDPDVYPYFHFSVEIQRETEPDAELATVDTALEVVRWYESRQSEYRRYWQSKMDEASDEIVREGCREALKADENRMCYAALLRAIEDTIQ